MASNATAFSNLGAARLYAGNFEDASVAWRRANQLDSNSASLSNLGTALYHIGKYEEALEQYRAAIAIDANDHRLWGNLGDNLRLLSGREIEAADAYSEAVKLAEAVIEVNPDDAYTLSRLAVYYAAIGKLALANEVIKRAEILAEFDLNVMYDLAVASVLLGNRKAAQEYSTRALSAGYPAVLIQADPQLIDTKASNSEK
jgi:tetratricopeptide (TPR) repeat protein